MPEADGCVATWIKDGISGLWLATRTNRLFPSDLYLYVQINKGKKTDSDILLIVILMNVWAAYIPPFCEKILLNRSSEEEQVTFAPKRRSKINQNRCMKHRSSSSFGLYLRKDEASV